MSLGATPSIGSPRLRRNSARCSRELVSIFTTGAAQLFRLAVSRSETCARPSGLAPAPRRLTTFWKVKSVLSPFIQMGCELRNAEADVVSDQGDVLNARYRFNPDDGAFVPILDLRDDEFFSSGEVAFWERRLGITIPNRRHKRRRICRIYLRSLFRGPRTRPLTGNADASAKAASFRSAIVGLRGLRCHGALNSPASVGAPSANVSDGPRR